MKKGKIFFENVAILIDEARKYVGRTADLTMCVTYFEVGRMIVEEEQGGKARAEYGSGLLAELSGFLTKRFGKGFSETNLKSARKFFQIYSSSIQQTMSAVLANQIGQTMSDESKNRKRQTMSDELEPSKSQSLISDLYPFKVSWSHYLILMRIENPDERRFYEIEAANQNWTVRQ